MGRSPCCAKVGLNRGAWSSTEDEILIDYIKLHGEGRWRALPKRAGLRRCGKSCRLRWLNYLRSDIKRGNMTEDEEDLIIRLHKLLGNRWSLIAGRLPERTDNEIKNYWNTNLKNKVQNEKQDQLDILNKSVTRSQQTVIKPKSPSPNIVVIKPKAVKCTRRVFIKSPTPAPPATIPVPAIWNTKKMGPTDETITNINTDTDMDTDTNGLVEGLKDEILAMDLNMIEGELDFSDFLNSPCMLDLYRQGLKEFSPEEPFVFPEEMKEDCGIDFSVVHWLLGDDH